MICAAISRETFYPTQRQNPHTDMGLTWADFVNNIWQENILHENKSAWTNYLYGTQYMVKHNSVDGKARWTYSELVSWYDVYFVNWYRWLLVHKYDDYKTIKSKKDTQDVFHWAFMLGCCNVWLMKVVPPQLFWASKLEILDLKPCSSITLFRNMY